MQKWEYKVAMGISEQELNAMGLQGWELVSVVQSEFEKVRRFYFKRPKA